MHPHEARIHALRLLKQYPHPGASVDGVTGLLGKGYRMEFKDKDHICVEGEPASCMFMLTVGRVAVLKRDFNGRERQVASMYAPSIFGHMSMVDGSPRSATCSAEGPVTVVVIDRDTYQHIIGEPNPIGRTLRRLLLSSLTDQLARGNKRIRELVGGDEPQSPSVPLAEPVTVITEEDIAEVSSELEGWRLRQIAVDEETDGHSANDADGPVLDEGR